MKYFLAFALLLTASVDSARILGVFQMPSFSHQCVFQPIWKELSLRGHQVTVVTTDPLRDPTLVNLTEIDISGETYKIKNKFKFYKFMNKMNPVHTKIQKIFEFNYELAEEVYKKKEFIDIYNNSNEKFDLMIAQTYISPILYPVAAKLNVPYVGVSSMGAWIGTHYAMGNPNPPSLYSEMFLNYKGRMMFFERFKSTLYYLWSRYYVNFDALPKCDSIARRYLGNNLPYIKEIEKNMSLLLLSTNPILYVPRPNVPTIISMEQMHVKPVKPLPKDIQQFLDGAKDGAIYFSLGSNVQSIGIPEQLRKLLTDTFAELPFRVLWKFEGNELPGKPRNVYTGKWIPQQDVLAHPNVKVFVTQCGLQSIEESISRGVPMVGMPFMADQVENMERLTEEGALVGLDYLTLTKEQMKKAIFEVVNNPKYKENVERLEKLWVDHPMKSLDRAIWWIEYVIRHKGTKHLRSPTADVPWYEYLLVDVIFVICLVIGICVCITVAAIKFVFRMFSGKHEKQKRN